MCPFKAEYNIFHSILLYAQVFVKKRMIQIAFTPKLENGVTV